MSINFNIAPKICIWYFWLVLASMLPIYWHFLRADDVSGTGQIGAFMLTMLICPIAFASGVRWYLIPRTQHIGAIILLMWIGTSVGESLCFFGFFLFEHYQGVFFIAAVLMVAQFIPINLIQKAEPLALSNH